VPGGANVRMPVPFFTTRSIDHRGDGNSEEMLCPEKIRLVDLCRHRGARPDVWPVFCG
jgi:hypothetical protein